MSANELRGGMDYDIGSVLDRLQQVRAWKCVVYDKWNAMLMSNRSYRFDIKDIAFRITDRLRVQSFGLVRYRRPEIVRVGRIHKGHLDSQLGKRRGKQVIGSAV
ncbi:hypothetical protein D3C77_706320 [compost metagenome]